MTPDEVAILSGRAEALGLDLTREVEAQLSVYQGLLRERGDRMNLVSRGDLARIAEVHFVDCMRPLPYLPAVRGARVLDLGSGAGLPGIVLKAFRPDLALFLVEASRRKSLFLRHVMEELGFEADRVLNVRAETLAGDRRIAGTMDAVVARAVSDLGRIATWSLPLLRPGGPLLAFKPSNPSPEIQTADRKGQLQGFRWPDILDERDPESSRGTLVRLVKELGS